MTGKQPPPTRTPVLPDVLAPGLRLVFCGSAAGRKSAAVGAYYAGPGNKFWPTLHEIGLTPRLFAPREFPRLLDLGIGLTDLAKWESGSDAALSRDAYDPDALRDKILRYRPAVLAFDGKAAARCFLGRPVVYGLQAERIDETALFVLPSPSGLARRWWDVAWWHRLAASTPPLPEPVHDAPRRSNARAASAATSRCR